jgi:rod shape determining protein RodA
MLLKRSLPKKSSYSNRRNSSFNLLKPWQQVDWLLIVLTCGLTVFGGIMIRSTELHLGLIDWWWHILAGGISLAIGMFIARCRYENLLQWHWITYGLTNISLIAVMLVGASSKGAQRWISIAGIQVQPSEFAKIGVIITLAALLHKETASNLNNVFRALAITAVPWALVFVQPDLATSLVFGAIVLGMLYWANANPGWLILFVSPIIAAILFSIQWPFSIVLFDKLQLGPLGIVWSFAMGLVGLATLPWQKFAVSGLGAFALNMLGGELGLFLWSNVLKEYQKNRITSFINPEADALGTGYHIIQSRTAVGAGQLWGQGLFKGPMTQLNFVPEQHTDFIFSAVGEEFGFVGCMLVIITLCIICYRLLRIAQTSKDNFGSLIAIGVLSMIVFQVVVNVGMNIGLAPVAGIPLPWMSYGRSAMLKNFICIGIVESIANFRHKKKKY